MNKNPYKSLLVIFFIAFFSCEEIEEEEKCIDATAEMLAALASFTQDGSPENCTTLKLAAQGYVSNECTDTTGFGGFDPNFIADSLNCSFITCELPIAQILQYSIVMGLSTDLDSLSYCAYYDSTIMAMETIIGNGCEIDGAPAITQAELDSAREAGCDWLQEITLLTATFYEEYDPSVKSFIFISDSDGSVLADTGFYNSGDDSFVLKKSYPKNQIVPEKIGVTTATYEPEYDDYILSSNLGVDIGSDFHYYNPYKDEPTDYIGQSYYIFNNVEDWTGDAALRLNTKGSRSAYTSCCNYNEATNTDQGSAYLNHYYDNEDVLIMLHRDDGTAGFINIEKVSIGDTNVVDLSALESAEIVQIPNNTGEVYSYHNFYGYGDNGSYSSWNRLASLKSRSGPGLDYSDDNFIVKYPQSVISRFRINTHVGGGYNSPGETQYTQITTGSLPSSVEKIDATLDLISTDLDNFEISHTGSFDQWNVFLRDTTTNTNWYVFNSSSSSTMVLPSIPTSISDEYSSLIEPSFSFEWIRLTDWMCADSYEEWIKLYHSSNGYYLDFCPGLRDLTYWPPE